MAAKQARYHGGVFESSAATVAEAKGFAVGQLDVVLVVGATDWLVRVVTLGALAVAVTGSSCRTFSH
ncbi:hypothetical protein [Nocardia brasiliensis]|uniref:hypothetical protein n=1 Tax=Nocardia brasiliensis TaxID=37326 RepID=UPI0024544199|nr:hypothetical protein [Nocardia brasiliensis]